VTAPRFLGYSFNPVSFWYVYNRDHALKKMILEVNNTFGERRIYLLDGSLPSSPARTPGLEPPASDLTKDKFTDVWMKDFHVSPFNSRKGSYALKARNPFPSPNELVPTIDNTITLKSSKDYAKVVARVNSTADALDPAKFGILDTARFVGGWWWVGFTTFPRIVREAFKLYFQRSLHVWFRPEVAASSLGRLPTSSEMCVPPHTFAPLADTPQHSPASIQNLPLPPRIHLPDSLSNNLLHRYPLHPLPDNHQYTLARTRRKHQTLRHPRHHPGLLLPLHPLCAYLRSSRPRMPLDRRKEPHSLDLAAGTLALPSRREAA
jgi:hypothetical protein